MNAYTLWLLLVGLLSLGAAWLPSALKQKPLSFPMIYVGLGMVIFALPINLHTPRPIAHGRLTEHLSELLVIVALTAVGLSLDRPLGLRAWGATWRLLGITMPLCIAAFAFIGWGWVGLPLASAMLLGAVLAPTDPVLAGDVQAPPPLKGRGNEVRFSLTSEAGLNDGLAFPFTNLAIAIAAAQATGRPWFWEWLGYDLLYKVAMGIFAGWLIGYTMGVLAFRLKVAPALARTGQGMVAIAITLIAYAATELAHGYGFLAVFVAALTLRRSEPYHDYHSKLHDMTEELERFLMALLLVLLGGAVVGGVLSPLTWQTAAAGLFFVFLVRPAAGMAGLIGSGISWREQATISFFGVRGIGSIYYLAYGLNHGPFQEGRLLWATVVFVILVSIIMHGITASPWMRRIEEE